MSFTDRDWELLQREMDGETTPEEQSNLRERLPREPGLAERREALREVGRRLAAVGLVEPPAGLVRDVLRAVRQRVGARGWGSVSPLAALLARRPALTLATSLAAGLVVGVLVTGLLGQGPLRHTDENWVAGTSLPRGRLGELPVIDRARLEGEGISADVVTRRGPGIVVAEIEIGPSGAADLTLELEGDGLRPRGFETADGLPADGALLEANRLQLRRAPPGRYRLALVVVGPDPAWLSVRLESGREPLEGRLRAQQ